MSESFAILWTAAHHALLSMGFPRQEYWSGLSLPSPRDLPNLGMESPCLLIAGRFLTAEPLEKPQGRIRVLENFTSELSENRRINRISTAKERRGGHLKASRVIRKQKQRPRGCKVNVPGMCGVTETSIWYEDALWGEGEKT